MKVVFLGEYFLVVHEKEKKSQERIISNSYVVKHSLKNLKNITIEINTLLLGSI